jgi:hypothetical protein
MRRSATKGTTVWTALFAPLLALVAASGEAQAPSGPAEPGSVGDTSGRPGLFRAGSFYFTPYLHIGTLGVDTNVFYTPTDRQTDFTASGGPGLEIVRPFGRESKFLVDGGLDYIYFAKTESQRKLNSYGKALLTSGGERASDRERYARSRPNYEVNDRVEQETEGTEGLLRRDLGDRLRFALFGSRQLTRTESYDYLGTNLGNTLTSDEYHAGGELQLALSVKTRFVAGAEEAWYRFPTARATAADAAYGGPHNDALTAASRSRHAVVPSRHGGNERRHATSMRPGPCRQDSWAGHTGATRLFVAGVREQADEPRQAGRSLIEKFTRSVYPPLRATVPPGLDEVVSCPRRLVVSERDDRIREAGAELGYQFRSRIRAEITSATRTEFPRSRPSGSRACWASRCSTPAAPTFR